MGKVEKVIVLSVLFLIALILVVSLTVDDPLDKSRVVEAGAPKGRPATTQTNVQPGGDVIAALPDSGKPGEAQPDANKPQPGVAPGTLSVLVDTNPTPVPQVAPTPPAGPATALIPTPPPAPVLPAGALLKTSEGLEDSILKDMKLYTWKEGDTYRVIANKYYGEGQKFTVLRRSNEGRTDLQPGDKIFIPVFDSEAASVTPPLAKGSAKGTTVATDPTAKKEAAKPSSGKVHVVKDGESLWKIAKQELGNGSRWEEIYELNKDVIPASKAVHIGLRLRIP
jgi:nucleoid-associated protein YgaU